MFVFVVSAILVQALIGANGSCLPRGPGSILPQELLLPSPNLPSLSYFNQELILPSPTLSYTQEIDIVRPAAELINYTPNLPLYNQELVYGQNLQQLPSLPTYTQGMSCGPVLPSPVLPSPVLPSPVLPTPGYQYGFNDLTVVGELPVGGTAGVNGVVPVNGALKFAGNVAANGRVSVSCGCGNYQTGPIYY